MNKKVWVVVGLILFGILIYTLGRINTPSNASSTRIQIRNTNRTNTPTSTPTYPRRPRWFPWAIMGGILVTLLVIAWLISEILVNIHVL